MRAAVLGSAGPVLHIEVMEEPEPGAGEVVVDVEACGICGSDLHVATSGGLPPGSVLGHEIAGRVAEVGPGVDAWSTGDLVVVRPFFGCDRCSWCAAGRADHCSSFAFVGAQRRGGFAERVVVAGRELYRPPTALAAPMRSMVEPLAVARRALRRAALRPDEDVVVLGGGPVGLAVVAWARTLGAGRIVVSEPVSLRRRLAEAVGADVVVDPSSDDLGPVVRRALGARPPLVLECSGVAGQIDAAMGLVAIDGRVAVVGICMGADRIVPWNGIHKEIDIRFALYYGTEDFVDTIDALDRQRLDPSAIVTDVVSLDQLPARFAQMTERHDSGKVVVVP